MKLSHLLGTIIVFALSSAGALVHETLSLKNSLAPKVLLPTTDVQTKGEHDMIEPVSDRDMVDYHPVSDGPLNKSVQSFIDHGLLSESGNAVSVRGVGDTLLREKDGADIVGSGGVVSASKPPYMYGSTLESAGTDGAATPRIEPLSDRDIVDYHLPTNDGLLDKSVESLIDHGVLSGSGSAVSVLGLGETFLREQGGGDIVSSYAPIHAGEKNNYAVVAVDRKLQSDLCPSLSAADFRAQISAYINRCNQGNCNSDLFGSKPINEWCTSKITDMTLAFHRVNFNDDISGWDVSKVTRMYAMFHQAWGFNHDLNTWDVSSVIEMNYMFKEINFNRELNSWDVSSVTRMDYMFLENEEFNQELNAWDVSSAQYLSWMFDKTLKFNQDLSAWNTSSVLSLGGTFQRSNFNGDITTWDVSSVTDMRWMFYSNKEFNQDLCGWDLSGTLRTNGLFRDASKFNQDLCSWRGAFQYESSSSTTFMGTACSTTAQPNALSKGPFCAQCSVASNCSMIPSTTTSAPTPAPWSIEFLNMSSNFGFHTSNTNEALVLIYNIGKGRNHDSFFYAGLCLGANSLVDPTGVITKKVDQVYDSATPAMSALKLSYDFNMSMISSSNIWNNNTKTLELCHVTRLVHKLEEPQKDLVIVESFYNLTIFFDLLKNFTLDIGLDEATINEVNDTADISDYIDAYYCDGSDAMNKLADDAELAPNEDLSVCFASESTDIEITEITSMVIKGVDNQEKSSQLTVMADGKASIPSITSFRFVNTTHVICTTRVPINMFDYERDDASIIVEGALTTDLQGSSPARKLMITSEAVTNGRILPESDDASDEEAMFDLSVNLKSGESAEEEETFLLESDAEPLVGLEGLFIIWKLFATAYAFW